jgi:hypothetical protein
MTTNVREQIVIIYTLDGRRFDLSNRSVDDMLATLTALGLRPEDICATVHGSREYVPPQWRPRGPNGAA